MSKNKKDYEDRKSLRRENFFKKKGLPIQKQENEEFKKKIKIKNEFKSKKIDMNQDELWEDWEEQLRKYNR
jgi:hypothetical protein